MRLLVLPVAVLLLVSGLAAGCGGGGSDTTAATTETASGTSAVQLKGVPWVLASGLEVNGWEDMAPSATFDAGKVTGFGGCNAYDAAVTVKGDSVDIGTVATKPKACPRPGGDVEKQYVTALGEVARWQLDGSALVLSNADGKELLRFSPASPARSWSVTGILQNGSMQSVIPGVPLTAVIKEDGSIQGSAGCNDYTADATVDRTKGTISISKPDAGDKACSNADMTAQEDAYLAALPTAARYVLAGRDLTLISADGTPVVTLTRVS